MGAWGEVNGTTYVSPESGEREEWKGVSGMQSIHGVFLFYRLFS